MSITKKDYVLIANVINSYYKSEIDGSYYNLSEGIADVLENTDFLFDRFRFLEACTKDLEAV